MIDALIDILHGNQHTPPAFMVGRMTTPSKGAASLDVSALGDNECAPQARRFLLKLSRPFAPFARTAGGFRRAFDVVSARAAMSRAEFSTPTSTVKA
jgi:hypothetical protein